MEFAETACTTDADDSCSWSRPDRCRSFFVREVFVKVFWSVAIGAAAGGLARFYLANFIHQRVGGDFPAGTLVINITGSILLGFIMRIALQTDFISVDVRALLTTGFCGGYTTFSTFSYDTALMIQEREYGRAGFYV